MNAYFDLMIVAHLILVMVSVRFMNRIGTNRLKWRGTFKLTLSTFLLIFTIYFRWWIACAIIVVVHILIFYLFFKKAFWRPCLAYLMAYYGLAFAMSLVSHDVALYHGVLVIEAPLGMLALLIAPLFLVVLAGVCRLVDQVYHLGNYRLEALIYVEEGRAKFQCYFDTGNTLTYQGVPVIFCLREAWPFPRRQKGGKVSVSSLNQTSEMELEEALIAYKDQAEKTLVYVALVDQKKDFNGCECLLNAYLR